MTQEILSRQGLPQDMQILLGDYPREAWPNHPNFARSIQNWLEAHQMFRDLAELVETETQVFLNKDRQANAYAARLGQYGDLLIRNLHGHHSWEDHSYFPELAAADPRFEPGLDLLENDHVELDKVLDDVTRCANRVIKLTHLDEAQAYDEAGALLTHAETTRAFLKRHLSDEEDLVVPILLHHKMRG
jgi:hemerythrin-like domain-containing protein